ncbi:MULTISPECIES: hypothetical protein [unclassified Duganella]|uniref:hypothetical protein n=1 Tax=unclassified Duganella TaxID=2636909 RepID=UPI000873B7C4|nr:MULTISPECIES: hypothetical protein [unclassified Duganella]OEZ63902.1 hypothetical protein DUGA6_04030 [Duganella sp. HH105]OFA06946.1 hypothetical protein DUGA2_02780 [Duganella sp. HH101]
MKRGSIRSIIPPAYQDLTQWPGPDIHHFEEAERHIFTARRQAVEGYAKGLAFEDILIATGKGRSEVKRLIYRCLAPGSSGQIQGFWALLPGWRVQKYSRSTPVSHSQGEGSGGCSGALGALFKQFPDIELLVKDLYVGKRKNDALPEARMSVREIHDEFKTQLLTMGFTKLQWPFNTKNCGYKSLANYLDNFRNENAKPTLAARSGKEAARRYSVGNGHTPLIPVLRPFSFVQMDYHKVDAASIFVIKNDDGKDFEVPLARWHFGLIAEEKSGSVLGFCVVLALNPSGDDALEIIQHAILPPPETDSGVHLAEGNNVVVSQLLPELKHQCFAVLRVDNAWANAANMVCNNIMSTVGCAINFGPAYAWWRRPLIERIFGELTRRGLQRLPSTFGTGPSDTKRDDPSAAASVFRIELDELIRLFKRCIREHNLKESEGRQHSSPIERLQFALNAPASGLFPQPLPATVQKFCPLMMHMVEVTVVGNRNKGVRPYFNLARHKHTNEQLASSFSLLGKKLIVYVDKQLARRVFAVVKETGEQLGQMRLYGAWANSSASWRTRQHVTNAGLSASYHREAVDPMKQHREEKEAQFAKMNKRERNASSRAALEVADMRRQEQKHAVSSNPPKAPVEPARSAQAPLAHKPDPLGLTSLPDISLVVKG